MYYVNFLIIPIIIVSFSCSLRLAYIVAMLASVGAAFFVYAQVSLVNILLTILLFNLLPLLCRRIKLLLSDKARSLEAEKIKARRIYEKIKEEDFIMKQANVRLSEESFRISELYKITRDMSAEVDALETFSIFGRRITEHFRFKRCRLVLVKDDTQALDIERVFEITYPLSHVKPVEASSFDRELLQHSLGGNRSAYFESADVPKDIHFPHLVESLVLVSLMAESKFFGVLTIEDLPCNELENFSTLANQLCLVMKRIKLYEHMQMLAIHDGLTGLFVRRYFMERLDEEAKRSLRRNLALSFLMIDIDHFKQCNDTYGHLTGDVMLREIAGVIKENVREIDLVARFGGEEFSVLLPNTDKEGAAYVAERIRSGIERQTFHAYNETLSLKVSIGVASLPEHAHVPQVLIDKSDQALYRAKQQGRNRVCIF